MTSFPFVQGHQGVPGGCDGVWRYPDGADPYSKCLCGRSSRQIMYSGITGTDEPATVVEGGGLTPPEKL